MNEPDRSTNESRADEDPTEISPDHGEEQFPADLANPFLLAGEPGFPIVALGGSAGSLTPLQDILAATPADAGMAYVVVLHLSPEHTSVMADILQRSTPMPVIQVQRRTKLEPNHVYVIPPGKHLAMVDGHVILSDLERERGKHVAVDLFFRTLADFHGPAAIAIVLSGADSDGAIGLKRIKERGGLTIAQDPQEATHTGMPRSAIDTGMVDWVLRAKEIPARIANYCRAGRNIGLPEPRLTGAVENLIPEAVARDILALLHARTGRDFSSYKRATILRRIARRMQVNGVQEATDYQQFLRTHPGETGALLQDLLISVTNFFRDREAFRALERLLPELFRGKGPGDAVRVWVPACATGEEAYSIAILLREHAATLEAPPKLHVFATDLDEAAVTAARAGEYPETIATDVSEERLRRHFVPHHGRYRVSQNLREIVLFAVHDILKNSPFSRVDLISCRNLLIYLNRDAQRSLFDIFHFALRPDGLLFLGSSETAEDAGALFTCIDKKHRISRRNSIARTSLPAPLPGRLLLLPEPSSLLALPLHASRENEYTPPAEAMKEVTPAELHLKLIERVGPPSIVVNHDGDIIHLSPGAGRYLQHSGGTPTMNLVRLVPPRLRGELRAALFQASQSRAPVELTSVSWELERKSVALNVSVLLLNEVSADFLLVVFREKPGADASEGAGRPPVATEGVIMNLERELELTKQQFRRTVEQHSAVNEEMKASNEELQAMNEELRSASEELETSREELQSVNEELITVNAELKSKVDELARTNSDLQNLMGATSIATIFLDGELRIKRYTPPAITIFNLIPTDAGRPLSDLTHRLEFGSIVADAEQVLRTLVPVEREVHSIHGHWYLTRVIPYRTGENQIVGVVLTFVDITARKNAEVELRQAQETLERRVQERTAELDEANQALRNEIAERQSAQKARQDLLRQLVGAQEQERGRISRELHDEVGQHLSALILGLKSLESGTDDPKETLRSLLEIATKMGDEIHALALELRPTALDDLGLLRTLQNYASIWSSRAKIAMNFHSVGLDAGRLPSHVESTLYRIACEALNNVLKHSHASQVSLILERRESQAVVIVEDNGRGFDLEALQQQSHRGRLGILGMRERANLLEGELAIESSPGRGTTVIARIPLRTEDAPGSP